MHLVVSSSCGLKSFFEAYLPSKMQSSQNRPNILSSLKDVEKMKVYEIIRWVAFVLNNILYLLSKQQTIRPRIGKTDGKILGTYFKT